MNKFTLYSNFHYHFLEFKLRLIYSIISFICTFLACYYYYFEIMYIFTKPFLYYEKNFIFTDLTEAFYTSIQISFFFSLYLILPLCMYQIWCFFIPSTFSNKRKNINFKFFIVFICLIVSIISVYLIILPKLYTFLLNFEINTTLLNIELEARINSYVKLACKIFILFSFIFLIPIWVFSLIKNKKIKIKILAKNRIKIFFCIVIFSSIVSPPDVFTQLIVSFFLQTFFEILIVFGFLYEKLEFC